MGFWDKFKQVAEPTAKIVGAVAPGPVGDVARVIDRVIADPGDPLNTNALRLLAEEVQLLKMRVQHLEATRNK